MAIEVVVAENAGGLLAEHFRQNEDEDRAAQATSKDEIDEGIASGGHDGSEKQGEHGIGMDFCWVESNGSLVSTGISRRVTVLDALPTRFSQIVCRGTRHSSIAHARLSLMGVHCSSAKESRPMAKSN